MALKAPDRGSRPGQHDDGGFTLVELLVVCLVMPLIAGAISVALIAVLTLQNGVSAHISDSADAQTVSAHFGQDIQASANLTTASTAACGPVATASGSGAQLLGLDWGYNTQTRAYQTVVSYVRVQHVPTWSLVRQYCAAGPSTSPTSVSTVSYDIPSTQPLPAITGSASGTDYNAAAAAGWTSTQGITAVTFAITEPGNGGTNSNNPFPYTLVALPVAGSSSPQLPAIASPTTRCGFATPSSGTWGSTLCFVSFTPYVPNPTTSCGVQPLAQAMSAAVTDTPFTMTFCLSLTGAASAAHTFPTYSGSFLGNNGFYTNVPGQPALYQTSSGTTTVTITNIQVLDSSGNSATGWDLVTGDAETTDPGESMTWTSDQNLSLLSNGGQLNRTSEIGNACSYTPDPTGTFFPGTYLTGLTPPNTKTVECAENVVSPNKTGTVMLEAGTPSSLKVTMVGTGLEAMFLGLLLP